ncbi:MAG TPA: Flp family type IVb pilin [Stellaceae bacterium]|nr:Flp family type IVb pilin [Stellaceae bacterium]
MSEFLRRLATNDSGVTAVEYTLLCALMGLVVVTSLRDVGLALNSTFATLAQALGR